jgi:hypothetical protein
VPDVYERRVGEFQEELAQLTSRCRTISRVRLALALLAAGSLYDWLARHSLIALWAGVACSVLFACSVWLHGRFKDRTRRAELMVKINEAALARAARRWSELALAELPEVVQSSPLSRDLNLFGRTSLMQLLADVMSPAGNRTLARWLVQSTDTAAVVERQSTVKMLAPQLNARQELSRIARHYPASEAPVQSLLRWAHSGQQGPDQAGLKLLAGANLVALPVLIVLRVAAVTALPLWALPVAVNVLLSLIWGRRIHRLFDEVAGSAPGLMQYAELIDGVGRLKGSGPWSRLTQQLDLNGHSAADRIRQLYTLCGLSELRRSILFVFVQPLTLWDFHVLWRLNAWRRLWGQAIQGWIEVLGEAEASCALASLHHDNPGWAFPTIESQGDDRIEALQLGHPLLTEAARVGNDVVVGPPGTLLLVTGSNMSGKSTLLRAIGTNIALANAGAPVCATRLRMPPCVLATSIKIQDSFEEGVSLFMAELQRMRDIVSLCRSRQARERHRVVFLLDEILRGTNSAERRTAVRKIVRTLLDCGAIGALTTHDLELTDGADWQEVCVPVHFREVIRRSGDSIQMEFDYRLRPGLATTSNALAILEMMGISTS